MLLRGKAGEVKPDVAMMRDRHGVLCCKSVILRGQKEKFIVSRPRIGAFQSRPERARIESAKNHVLI